jgi:predicted chitinase
MSVAFVRGFADFALAHPEIGEPVENEWVERGTPEAHDRVVRQDTTKGRLRYYEASGQILFFPVDVLAVIPTFQWASAAGVRLRTNPGTSQPILIEDLGFGRKLQVLGGPSDADGYSWLWVETADDQVRGWVATAYLLDHEPVISDDPWEFWGAEQIAQCSECPLARVQEHWPHLAAAMQQYGVWSQRSAAAMIATVTVESGMRPIHEYGTPADWANYDGGSAYAGRGYIQLTHRYNYQSYGDLIGVDLVNNPDLALDPRTAASVAALYWQKRGIMALADAGDWTAVRRAVQGGTAGLDRLVNIIRCLLG